MMELEEISKIAPKTILITGGAGFIGSHLCEKLLSLGFIVINIDNLNNFYNPLIKKKNLAEILNFITKNKIPDKNYSFQEGDIRDIDFLDKIFSEYKTECIIHLAAYAGVRPSISNPVLYTDVNINGTVNLLECAKKFKVKKIIFASSSSVYGNNKKVPFSEKDIVDMPISPYAATKKAGELLCHTYHHLYNINIAVLRFFTVFGPRQRPDLAIYKFTDLIYKDKEIPFFGDGTTKRDYTYISDILAGIIKSYKWLDKGKNKFDIFNLGESNTISLEKMVETLEFYTGRKAKLRHLDKQQGDVDITFADITKSKNILGYNPNVRFEDGIDEFIKWFNKNII